MAMGLAGGSGGRRGRGRRRAAMAEINVTPLVDVMLVLLIIFMVTAPLLVAGVPVELPESRATALSQEPNQVTLSIDAQGQVFLDEEAVAPGISEALFATAIGLFAAIPAVIAYNRFSHRVNALEAQLQRFADRFHATLSRELDSD